MERNLESPRVLLLAPQPFFVSRGTPLNVRAMVETLGKAGYAVDLLVFPLGENIELPGVRTLRSPMLPFVTVVPPGPSWAKLFLDIPFFFKAVYLSLRNRYAIHHGVEEGSLMAGVIALFSARPYVFDMDSCMPTQLRESGFISSRILSTVFEGVERFFMKRAAVALTVCEALSDKIHSAAPELPVCQIEDFPLEGAGESSAQKIAELRDEFGLHGSKVILYTGNFKSYQGIELLIRAFSLTKGAKLLIVGSGEESADLESLAGSLGIRDSVIFAGNRPLEDMGSFMALSDVLVSPRSEGENTPLKLYSYMAAQRPIVATRILSHTQVLSDSNAFLGEASPEGFAEAMEHCLQDTLAATEKAELAYELVQTRYSRAAFDSKLLALYDGLLSDKLGDQVGKNKIADNASIDSSKKIVGNDS